MGSYTNKCLPNIQNRRGKKTLGLLSQNIQGSSPHPPQNNRSLFCSQQQKLEVAEMAVRAWPHISGHAATSWACAAPGHHQCWHWVGTWNSISNVEIWYQEIWLLCEMGSDVAKRECRKHLGGTAVFFRSYTLPKGQAQACLESTGICWVTVRSFGSGSEISASLQKGPTWCSQQQWVWGGWSANSGIDGCLSGSGRW